MRYFPLFLHLKHICLKCALNVKIRENNASYRKPKGKFRTKKVAKILKFFFENFSIKPFQRTSERFQATNTRACGNLFVKNKRKSWFQVLLKHAICRKTREKNASYRKPKENFRTKKVAKILKIFFSKTSVLNISSALPNVSRRRTHARVATLSWKIGQKSNIEQLIALFCPLEQ